jgi:hypothetical protein
VNRDYERRRDLLLLHADSPPPWTPAALGAALVGWWEADSVTLNGGNVAAMTDKSGGGHPFAQSAAGRQPTYNATGSPTGGPVVVFDGVDDYLKTAATFAVVQPAHYVLVHKTTQTEDYDTILSGGEIDGNKHQISTSILGSAYINVYAGSTASANGMFSNGQWSVTDVVFNGAASKIAKDGGAQSIVDAGTGESHGILLGCRNDIALFPVIDLVGLLITNREMTSFERASAVAYFRAKAGF